MPPERPIAGLVRGYEGDGAASFVENGREFRGDATLILLCE